MKLRSLLLTTALGLTSCISVGISRPSVVTDTLYVNTNNSQRYITRMNEAEGIKKIRHLLETSEFEEAWTYLPEKKEWHEVGINEKKPSTENSEDYCSSDGVFSLVFEPGYVRKLVQENESAIIYHFHPFFFRNLDNQMEHAQGKEIQRYVPRLLFTIMPSGEDIHTMALHELGYFNDVKADVSWKVVSKYGIVEYGLTREAMKEYSFRAGKNLEDAISQYLYLSTKLFIGMVLPSIENPTSQEITDAFFERLRGTNFTFDFTPFKQ